MHDFKSPQRHLHAIFHVPSYQLRRQTHAIRSRTVPLLLPRLLRIAAHNLDLLRRDIVLIVELEVDVFDKERPDFVAEAVGIQMTLFFCNEPPISLANNLSPRRRERKKKGATRTGAATLKFMRALTLSASTSVMDLSKVAMTFMAVWGSMR